VAKSATLRSVEAEAAESVTSLLLELAAAEGEELEM